MKGGPQPKVNVDDQIAAIPSTKMVDDYLPLYRDRNTRTVKLFHVQVKLHGCCYEYYGFYQCKRLITEEIGAKWIILLLTKDYVTSLHSIPSAPQDVVNKEYLDEKSVENDLD